MGDFSVSSVSASSHDAAVFTPDALALSDITNNSAPRLFSIANGWHKHLSERMCAKTLKERASGQAFASQMSHAKHK